MKLNIAEIFGLLLVVGGLYFSFRESKMEEIAVKPQPSVKLQAQTVPVAVIEPSRIPEVSPPSGKERLIFKTVNSDFDAWIQETRDQYDIFLDRLEERFARPTREPIFVSFYSEKEKHLPTWGEGFFDGEIKISKKFLEKNPQKARTVIRHEIVHAYLGAGWPTWLDEGLADYLSCEGENCETFKFPPLPGKLLSSAELRKNMQSMSRNDAKRMYLQSAFLVRHLFSKYGDTFWQDLKLRAQGSPAREQFVMCGCTEDELLAQVADNWRKRKVSFNP